MAWWEPGAAVTALALVFRCETGTSGSFKGFAGEFGTVGFEAGEARPIERFGALLNLLGKGLRGGKRFAAFQFGAGEEFGSLAYVVGRADLNPPRAPRPRRAAAAGPGRHAALRRLFNRGRDFIGAMGARRSRPRGCAYRGRGCGREFSAVSWTARCWRGLSVCLSPL